MIRCLTLNCCTWRKMLPLAFGILQNNPARVTVVDILLLKRGLKYNGDASGGGRGGGGRGGH